MKTKLILGAVSVAILLGGAFTVSAQQSPARPTSVRQTSHIEPVPAPAVATAPAAVPETANDNAAPAPEVSAEVSTPHRGNDGSAETPAAPTYLPCSLSMAVGTKCYAADPTWKIIGTIISKEGFTYVVRVTAADNPTETVPNGQVDITMNDVSGGQ